jgi:hypothetical protein
MSDQPVYLRIPTEHEQPLFESHSCAEVVIGVVVKAQEIGYMRLHGFVVLPGTLELVATPINMSVGALVGYIQSETIPLLSVLVPNSGMIWNRYFMRTPLETQRALDARLNMLLLSPVAHGLTNDAESYAYSSSNPRYSGAITPFTDYQRFASLPQTAPLNSGDDEETATDLPSINSGVAKSES